MTRTLPLALLLVACQPADGLVGPPGPQGEPGPMGAMGAPGKDGTGSAASNKDGVRIRIRYMSSILTTEDGARMEGSRSAVMYDTKLSAVCSGQFAEDGAVRCLPKAAEVSGVTYYADSGCAQRAVIAAPQDQFAQEYVGPSKNRIYQLGADTASIYEMGPTCGPAKGQIPAGYVAKRIDRTMAASEFVAITRTTELTP